VAGSSNNAVGVCKMCSVQACARFHGETCTRCHIFYCYVDQSRHPHSVNAGVLTAFPRTTIGLIDHVASYLDNPTEQYRRLLQNEAAELSRRLPQKDVGFDFLNLIAALKSQGESFRIPNDLKDRMAALRTKLMATAERTALEQR
jgi:hypothetical protein